MKNSKHWITRLADSTDLFGENPPWLPIVEVAGDNRVLIEKHKGIIAYAADHICVRVSYGIIRICGRDLELRQMTREQLVISGQIDSVNLCRRG